MSIRGGGLLMLGGPKAFSQGDWQKTALTDVLPVELYSEQMAVLKNQQAIYKNPFNLQLTPAGFRTPMLQFFPDVKENKQAWNSLPQLLGFHLVGAAKPGATILAKHPAAREKDEHIVMASQNYGRGRTMVMATSSFWRWQMQLPASDNRHEQFWRQIARWLTLSTPPPISVEMDKNSYSPNEKIKMHITVLDSQFQVVPDAQVSVQIKQPVNYLGAGTAQGDPPVGELINLKPVLNLNKPGNYTCEFLPKEEGFYLADVFVHSNNGAYIGHADGAFITKDKNREFLNPALNENYLKHIAQLSKGNFYRIENASELPDKLAVTETVYTKLIEQDLWDAPILFFLILLLLTLEWSIRRARGVS